jgi:hypothetical protein
MSSRKSLQRSNSRRMSWLWHAQACWYGKTASEATRTGTCRCSGVTGSCTRLLQHLSAAPVFVETPQPACAALVSRQTQRLAFSDHNESHDPGVYTYVLSVSTVRKCYTR